MKLLVLPLIFLHLNFIPSFSYKIDNLTAVFDGESRLQLMLEKTFNKNEEKVPNLNISTSQAEVDKLNRSVSTFPVPVPLNRLKRDSNKNESGECECGLKQNTRKPAENDLEVQSIVDGEHAEIHEFPWRCALLHGDFSEDSYSFFCGCSIIHESWVMTAAHCTDKYSTGYATGRSARRNLFVDVGDYDLSTAKETRNRIIRVSKLYQHPDFNSRTFNNDISLIKLASPIGSSDNAAPICLPFRLKNWSFVYSTVTASGWGRRFEGKKERPTVLNKVDLSVVSQTQCRRLLKGKINENMLCALTPGKDTCQGDSGGSLDFQKSDSEKFYAIGVVSFGYGCGRRESPGVYTRVTRYLSFIKETTGETFCGE